MACLSNTHADKPSASFLWEALFLGDDARRAASREVNRIIQELAEATLCHGPQDNTFINTS